MIKNIHFSTMGGRRTRNRKADVVEQENDISDATTMGGRRTSNRKANVLEQENETSDIERIDPSVPPTAHAAANAVSDGTIHIEALLKSLPIHSGNNVGVRMDTFDGLPNSNATGWLQKFRSYVHLNGWDKNPDRVIHTMRLLFEGPASSFLDKIRPSDTDSVEHIFDAFTSHFISSQSNWLLEQQLWDRSLNDHETLDTFMTSIDQLCARLHKTEADKVSYFVRGLPNNIRFSVIQSRPSNLLDAYQSARLAMLHLAPSDVSRTSAINSTPDPSAELIKQREEIDELKRMFISATSGGGTSFSSTASGQARHQNNVTCQICFRPNHTAATCRQRNARMPARGRGGAYNARIRSCYICGDSSHLSFNCHLNSERPGMNLGRANPNGQY